MPWNRSGGDKGDGNKDPWGQNGGRGGGNEGPPDLDEIVRNIQKKLSGLFGGSGGGNRRGGGDAGSEGTGALFGLIASIALLIWVAWGTYIIKEGELGVVLRFGAKVAVTEPGLHWHLPWPVESVEKVNVQKVYDIEIGYRSNRDGSKTLVTGEALMLTQDENIVDLQINVQYRISDPMAYLFNVKNVEATIVQATESAIREVAGKSTMEYIITDGRVDVVQRTKKLLQETLTLYLSGVQVVNLKMLKAKYPPEVQAAVDDAIKSREDEDRIKKEAEAYANDILPRARGKAARMVQEAEGYRAAVIARAEGDARRFSLIAREYAKAPRVTRTRLYIEALEHIYSRTTKVMVDQKSGGNSLIYLPIDKLMARAANEAGRRMETTVEPTPPSTSAPVAPSVPETTKEGVRHRPTSRRVPQ